ncbi:type III PLP-dependent enzyme [Paenibacillus sp. KS-LC4]|uniref:type III PLP-dependent enzyme n=1 Tax=Paenibacillus sp. KS-LC4 TaxID=2979727 RepID=UPI0030CFBE96
MMNINHDEVFRLADMHETPFYLYDGDFLESHYRTIREMFDPSISFYLSLKSNNNVYLASLFQSWGTGVEVASVGEIVLANKAGFTTGQMIFSGPGKKKSELEYAVQVGIGCIIAESADELRAIKTIVEYANKEVSVAIRINPDKSMANTAIKMGGAPRQFGIDESMLEEAMCVIQASQSIIFAGIHVYGGTQNLNHDAIVESVRYTVGLAVKIYEQYGYICRMVNLGGGFGIPYFPHEVPLNAAELAARINAIVQDARKTNFKDTVFIIESGRYLLAQSAIYVTRVLYSKLSKGERFIIVDGGMHHHAASTFRGRNIRNNFPLGFISKVSGEASQEEATLEKASIVGPLCTPEDCIGKGINVPVLQAGDIVYVLNSGAYGLSYSPIQFLGHPSPAELLNHRGQCRIIRRRGDSEDLLVNQVFSDQIVNPILGE